MIKVWNAIFDLHPEFKRCNLAAFVTSEYIEKNLNLLNKDETLLVCQHISWINNPDCLDWFKINPPYMIFSVVPNDYWELKTTKHDLEYLVYAFKKGIGSMTPTLKYLSPPRKKDNVSILPSKESPKRKRFQFYLAKAKR